MMMTVAPLTWCCASRADHIKSTCFKCSTQDCKFVKSVLLGLMLTGNLVHRWQTLRCISKCTRSVSGSDGKWQTVILARRVHRLGRFTLRGTAWVVLCFVDGKTAVRTSHAMRHKRKSPNRRPSSRSPRADSAAALTSEEEQQQQQQHDGEEGSERAASRSPRNQQQHQKNVLEVAIDAIGGAFQVAGGAFLGLIFKDNRLLIENKSSSRSPPRNQHKSSPRRAADKAEASSAEQVAEQGKDSKAKDTSSVEQAETLPAVADTAAAGEGRAALAVSDVLLGDVPAADATADSTDSTEPDPGPETHAAELASAADTSVDVEQRAGDDTEPVTAAAAAAESSDEAAAAAAEEPAEEAETDDPLAALKALTLLEGGAVPAETAEDDASVVLSDAEAEEAAEADASGSNGSSTAAEAATGDTAASDDSAESQALPPTADSSSSAEPEEAAEESSEDLDSSSSSRKGADYYMEASASSSITNNNNSAAAPLTPPRSELSTPPKGLSPLVLTTPSFTSYNGTAAAATDAAAADAGDEAADSSSAAVNGSNGSSSSTGGGGGEGSRGPRTPFSAEASQHLRNNFPVAASPARAVAGFDVEEAFTWLASCYFELNPLQVSVGPVIAAGAFAEVHEGTLSTPFVAAGVHVRRGSAASTATAAATPVDSSSSSSEQQAVDSSSSSNSSSSSQRRGSSSTTTTSSSSSSSATHVAVKLQPIPPDPIEQANLLGELAVLKAFCSGGKSQRLVTYYGAALLDTESDSSNSSSSCHGSSGPPRVMMVMELCVNGAVREALKLPLSWSLKTRIASDLAQALACLAEHGVIHRDVKTTNVLLDSAWRAKLCDFNLAIEDASATKLSHAAGTTEFMSPEALLGDDFTFSSDMFSYGITLLEIITGRAPGSQGFLERHPRSLFAVDEDDLLAAQPQDVPQSLWALATLCCDTEMEERQTAEEAVDWLAQTLSEEFSGAVELPDAQQAEEASARARALAGAAAGRRDSTVAAAAVVGALRPGGGLWRQLSGEIAEAREGRRLQGVMSAASLRQARAGNRDEKEAEWVQLVAARKTPAGGVRSARSSSGGRSSRRSAGGGAASRRRGSTQMQQEAVLPQQQQHQQQHATKQHRKSKTAGAALSASSYADPLAADNAAEDEEDSCDDDGATACVLGSDDELGSGGYNSGGDYCSGGPSSPLSDLDAAAAALNQPLGNGFLESVQHLDSELSARRARASRSDSSDTWTQVGAGFSTSSSNGGAGGSSSGAAAAATAAGDAAGGEAVVTVQQYQKTMMELTGGVVDPHVVRKNILGVADALAAATQHPVAAVQAALNAATACVRAVIPSDDDLAGGGCDDAASAFDSTAGDEGNSLEG
jgi:trimeric autotransporter adhesin